MKSFIQAGYRKSWRQSYISVVICAERTKQNKMVDIEPNQSLMLAWNGARQRHGSERQTIVASPLASGRASF